MRSEKPQNKEGINSPLLFVPGFKAAGISCGIKRGGKKDLALIYSEVPATVAGVFTTNTVKAAPVIIDAERIKRGFCQAIIINSGNANACTGKRGLKDAREMVELTEKALGIKRGLAFVSSTGVIGEFLPMDKIKQGILTLNSELRTPNSVHGWQDAAEAIMTTDTFPKIAMEKGRVGGREVTILGIAKGAGMICPDMATMLAFLSTDVAIEQKTLQAALKTAVDNSFNCITVDGDTSTNDTVLILANGMAGNKQLTAHSSQLTVFYEMLEKVCLKLAHLIVRDGEGATKFLGFSVKGARTERDAECVARTVANSLLVKTAFFGEDANWGRIMAAIGRSGVKVDQARIDISFNGVPVVRKGIGTGRDGDASRVIKEKDIIVTIDLGLGKKDATIWTTDLSYDYVKVNAGYRS